MTTTKTLIEAATLTDTGIWDALGTWPPGRKSSQPDYALVADAARDKALWAMVDWLTNVDAPDHSMVTAVALTLAGLLENQLAAGGIERPKE